MVIRKRICIHDDSSLGTVYFLFHPSSVTESIFDSVAIFPYANYDTQKKNKEQEILNIYLTTILTVVF